MSRRILAQPSPPRRAALALALLLAVGAAAQAGATPEFGGHWEGAISLPSLELGIRVDFQPSETGTWSGSIDIPMQGAKGLPLAGVALNGDAVEFAIAGIPGDPRFSGRLDETGIAGNFTQGGQSFPFHLGRETAALPKRPQEPAPPFPYRTEEVKVDCGAVTLAGSLTLPEGAGPFAAALLVSGSGPQNRDEELLGHKPFLVLSDFLTRAGIAVLRLDDRGVGGSTGALGEATTEVMATDALACVAFLAGRPEIDAKRIGIVGHSEGGLIGPLAASRSALVAFVVMMAGPGVPGAELLPLQSERIQRAMGAADADVQAQREAMRALLALVMAGADSAALRAKAEVLAQAQMAALPDSLRPSPADVSQQLDQQLRSMTQPWFRYFISYDPRPALRQVKVPVLAINGEFDLQVPPDQNLPEIERALQEAGNADATVRRLPGLNHLFQPTTSGDPSEYGSIETTIDPLALETIRDWILARTATP